METSRDGMLGEPPDDEENHDEGNDADNGLDGK